MQLIRVRKEFIRNDVVFEEGQFYLLDQEFADRLADNWVAVKVDGLPTYSVRDIDGRVVDYEGSQSSAPKPGKGNKKSAKATES